MFAPTGDIEGDNGNLRTGEMVVPVLLVSLGDKEAFYRTCDLKKKLKLRERRKSRLWSAGLRTNQMHGYSIKIVTRALYMVIHIIQSCMWVQIQ
ncbi:hypothetical protein SLA2020_050850 [Shorea laevis]